MKTGLDSARLWSWLRSSRRAAAAFLDGRAFLGSRLRNEDDAARLRAAQLSTITRYGALTIVANAFNAVVLIAALSFRPLSAPPYVWFGILTLYLTHVARRLSARRRRSPPVAAGRGVIRRAILHAALLGAIWGAAPMLFFDAGKADELIVACVSIGMLAAGAFVLAALPEAAIVFVLSVAAGSLGGLFRGANGPIDYLAAPLIFSYVAVLLLAAVAHGRQFADRVLGQVRAEAAARHDRLTGLPNRMALEAAVAASFRRLDQYGERFALFLVDLVDFKGLNDRLGRQAGDHLLRQVAGRLAGAVRDRELVARLGDDEFAFIARGAVDAIGAAKRADQIARFFEAPFTLDGAPALCWARIGIALAPSDGENAVALLGHADAALHKAKRARGVAAHFYSAAEDREAQDQRELAHDLIGAVGRGEFFLQFQPIRSLETRRIEACEALVRWRHPRRGLISPTQFIPIAEQTGAVHELGEWVMLRACAEAMRWPEDVRVAVNVSAQQICDLSISRIIESTLLQTRLPARRLEVEITESALFGGANAIPAALERLNEIGVSIVIDDFGTGFSSFDRIRRLPVSGVKIDRSFVADLPFDHKSGAIVQAIVHLARALDLTVVAEGIETEAQLEFLRLVRCDFAQGDYFARPQSADGLVGMVSTAGGLERDVA